MTRSRVTLLQQKITRRRLTREEAIQVLDQRAHRMNIRDFALSVRQLDRWLAGEVTSLPRPSMCRVLEAEFGEPVERLLHFINDVPMLPTTPDADIPSVRAMVSQAAQRSARFGQWADALGIGELALATLWLRLGQLAVDYVHAPMIPVFRELESMRDDVFELLSAPDPGQARDLYLIAGTTCGLLAHASGNLGHVAAAQVQACTALICARKAEHPTLAAWVLGVRALQSEWSGRPVDGLRFACQAHAEAEHERVPSTVSVWLSAIEARAHARLGNRAKALDALHRAAHDRGRLLDQPGDESEFDRVGGILTFTEAKQHYYAGTAYRRIGDFRAAAEHSLAAITAYADGPVEQRSYGDEIIAWTDLAIARASGKQLDLDGAAEALHAIEEQPTNWCLPTLLGPLRDLNAALSTARVRDAARAVAMRRSIADMIASCQRPAVEAGTA
jgi:hypothetical protein